MLFIAALIVAFAQPYKTATNQIDSESVNNVGIYIDNSMSMQLRSRELSLLDESRHKAINIARKFGLSSSFYLISNDFLPQHQRELNLSEFIQETGQMPAGAPPVNISDVFARAKALQDNELDDNRIQFIISDFQKSTFDIEQLVPDSSLHLFLVSAVPNKIANLFIDTCWFESPVLHPGIPLLLKVRLGNASDEEARSIPLSLEIEGVQTAVSNVDVPANGFFETTMQFSVSRYGFHQAQLSILDFPVVFDDVMYFSFEVRSEIQILEIHEGKPNPWLRLLFVEDEHIQFISENRHQLDLRSLQTYDLVVLSSVENLPTGLLNALQQYVNEGGSLVIIPSINGVSALQELTLGLGFEYLPQPDTFNTRVFHVESQHPLLREVFVKIPENPDFPSIFSHYTIRFSPQTTSRSIINLLNGNPFLVTAPAGSGQVYAFTTPIELNWTDFPSNSLFVPVFYRMALLSVRHQSHYYLAGNEIQQLFLAAKELNPYELRIRSVADEMEYIPGVRIASGRQELYLPEVNLLAGHYELFENDQVLLVFSINDNRKESHLNYYDINDLSASLTGRFKSVTIMDSLSAEGSDDLNVLTGANRWYQYFVLLALIFLLVEILLIRFWNK